MHIQITDYFDKADHGQLTKRLVFPIKYKFGIFRALKAGLLDTSSLKASHILGGSTLTPLLVNILLHGLENISPTDSLSIYPNSTVRYGNEVVYILRSEHDERVLVEKIRVFLDIRGLILPLSTIISRKCKEGFDFLGWHFISVKDKKSMCYPSKQNWINFRAHVKATLKRPKYPIKTRVEKVNSIVTHWYTYHQFCDVSKLSPQLYHLKKWYSKYLRLTTTISKKERLVSLHRIFNERRSGCYGPNLTHLFKNRSPYEGNFEYWITCKSISSIDYVKNTLVRQKYKCWYCRLTFVSEDKVEIQQINGDQFSWSSATLVAFHTCCLRLHRFPRNETFFLRKKMINRN